MRRSDILMVLIIDMAYFGRYPNSTAWIGYGKFLIQSPSLSYIKRVITIQSYDIVQPRIFLIYISALVLSSILGLSLFDEVARFFKEKAVIDTIDV